MSSLERTKEGYTNPVFGQIFLDSCDEGFILVSHKTGLEVRYVVTHKETSEDGILWWHLIAIPGQTAAANGTSIRIYNDYTKTR